MDGWFAALVCALLDHVQADFAGVGGLHLDLDAVQGPLELLVGACVRHLAPHLCGVWGPEDIEDPALWHILRGGEVEVKHCESAVVFREGLGEILIGGIALPGLVHNDLLLVLQPVGYEAVHPLGLELHEPQLAVVMDPST